MTPAEFEELILGDPLYLEYQTENGEERFKVLGVTEAGRILIGVFTLRAGKIRAITAYRAGAPYRKLFLENQL